MIRRHMKRRRLLVLRSFRVPLALVSLGLLGLVILVFGLHHAGAAASHGPAAAPPRALDGPEVAKTYNETTWYAETYGVSEDEAVRRAQLQEASHAVKRALRDAAPDRLSAVWLEQSPRFQVVAWYTGSAQSLPQA